MRPRNFALVLILLTCPATWALAEDAAEVDDSKWGYYVIRPGDTIIGLTRRYLGSPERWRENYALNDKDIADPDVITPGDHIRLLLPEKLPDGAQLRRISNRVEDQSTSLTVYCRDRPRDDQCSDDWADAKQWEILQSRDGIHTYKKSSALLQFPDGTVLALTEDSLVFLSDEKPTQEEVERTQIEVKLGQADLSVEAGAEAPEQFEIILGDATATPQPGEDGSLATRARRPESGGAQLMVYSGQSDLEAAGATVKVATGMGSSVPEGEPPKPPEKLLPAPAGLEPGAGARLATPRPAFAWQAVDGARDYTIEVCRDASCGALVERVVAVAAASWQPEDLPVEKLFWRVTAVAKSGLDGYPSDAVSFEILTDTEDTSAPEVNVSFTDPRLAPRYGLNDRWIVGPGMEVEVEATDEGSGVDRWTPSIDGKEVEKSALKGPWQRGEHTVSVTAVDRAGNEQEVEVPFIYDPDPPEFSWGFEGDPVAVGSTGGDPGDDLGGPSPSMRGRREVKTNKHLWRVDSDLRHVVLRLLSGKPIGLEGLGALGKDQGLWVRADDAVCSDLRDVTYEVEPGIAKNTYVLRIEAIDCVGNARRGSVPLARHRK
ncbi:MAG: hypothetical protein GY719_01700 [bacterium]|nr:hypothetical protein [bacterium]